MASPRKFRPVTMTDLAWMPFDFERGTASAVLFGCITLEAGGEGDTSAKCRRILEQADRLLAVLDEELSQREVVSG